MNRGRLAAGVFGVATLLVAAFPDPAHAAATSVSAGERIHSANGICSLAYTFRSRANGHTYGISAAHCQQPGSPTARTDTGAVATFIRTALDPAGTGGADFALLDFGTSASPGRYVGDQPLLYGLERPQPGETICRTGATTGTHCGVVAGTRSPMQYLTAPGMTACAGGDSGGAVWVRRDGGAQIIGVWLGGVTLPDGTDRGRFASITDGFTALGLL